MAATMAAAPTDPHVRLELRPYQVEALDKVQAAQRRGVNAQLGVAATGLGKTVMFCALAERMGCRTLVLAHRDELITQARAKVLEVMPGADVGIVKGSTNEVHSHIVVASVQTLARANRLAKLVQPWAEPGLLSGAERFGLVVTDEAHRAAADSYQRIYSALEAGQPGGPLHLGVTATPKRGDGQGLDKTFQEVVFSYDILWGIRAGYLSDLRGLAVHLDRFQLADVKVTAGDYNAGQAGTLMLAAGAPELLLRAWQKHASERKTLVFTPTVEMADAVAEVFTAAGVAAGMVHGGTPIDERRRALADFSAGRLQVMANCAVLTEGYDEPTVDCVVIARPTKSQGLYVQMVGRGTRRHPDKADCLVLDVVGATDDHSLCTIPSLFGLDKARRGKGQDGSDLMSRVVEDQVRQQAAEGKLRAEEVALFDQVRAEGIAWVRVHKDGARRRYVRPLGKDREGNPLPVVHLFHAKDGDEGWLAGLEFPDGSKRVLISEVGMEMAQGVGEDYARTNSPSLALVDPLAAWRQRKPGKRQREAAKKWHLAVDPKWTAGELADALDAHIARIKTKKRKG